MKDTHHPRLDLSLLLGSRFAIEHSEYVIWQPDGRANETARARWGPLFSKCRVDLVLTGQWHDCLRPPGAEIVGFRSTPDR
jgi:hypothetical protein